MLVDILPEDGQILRPLGPTEELVLRFQKQAEFCATANNIACHVQLDGAQLTPDVLREALGIVIPRHPLLHALIAPAPRKGIRWWFQRHYVFVEGTAPVPITILEDKDWREVMQGSFQQAWTLEGGAPLRAYLITNMAEGRQDLVFWLSHIVSDGLSLFSLMVELLNVAAELTEGREITPAEPHPLFHDIWAYSPDNKIHWGQVLKRVSHYIKTPFSPRVFQPPTDAQVVQTEFKTQYLHYVWSEDASSEIVARAKEQQISVGSMVGAALLMAVNESAPPERKHKLGLSNIVDLRRRAKPSVPFDNMGHCASQVQTYYEITPERPLRDLAKEIQGKVHHVLETGIMWDVGRLIRLIAPVLLNMLHRGPIKFPHSVLLSNVGRLQIPPHIGPFNLLECHATADFSFGEGYIFLAFSTFNGRMTLDWTFGRIAPPLIAQYTERMFSLLTT